jgi:hypothetical protein
MCFNFLIFFKEYKLHGDYCQSNSDCDPSGHYICDLNTCSCSTKAWLSNGGCCRNIIFIKKSLNSFRK